MQENPIIPANDSPLQPSPAPAPEVAKGDVLEPAWGEAPPWFGYIGVGIALAAMVAGLAGMVEAARYWLAWVGS